MILLQYRSNNSGGGWWLTDEDWKKLESRGWKVKWCAKDPAMKHYCTEGRWLGALAEAAEKTFETPEAGVAEWSEITGQDPWEEGCNCCGQPHNFSYGKNGETHWPSISRGKNSGSW